VAWRMAQVAPEGDDKHDQQGQQESSSTNSWSSSKSKSRSKSILAEMTVKGVMGDGRHAAEEDNPMRKTGSMVSADDELRANIKDTAGFLRVRQLLIDLGVTEEVRLRFAEQDLTIESLLAFENDEFRSLGVNAGLRFRIKQAAQDVHDKYLTDYLAPPTPVASTEAKDLTPPATGPKHPQERGGGKCYVDVGFEVLSVSEINTATSSVSLQLQMVFYWTDSRFINWPNNKPLPSNTWGPAVRVKGEVSECAPSDVTFAIFNVETGRMKRCVMYTLEIDWTNDENLPNFPFDAHDFTVWMRSASDFASFSNEHRGNSATEHQYMFRAAIRKKGVCGSDFLKVIWDRRHHGWKCHGISTELDYEGIVASGYEPTNLKLHFHISRRENYYYFQMLVPLYLTTILSWAAYLEPVSTGLESRINIALTCLLAQFALLYIVQEHLPNLPFLTALDYAVFTSVFATGTSGISSMLVFWIDDEYSSDVAESMNKRLGQVTICLYVLANAYFMIPKMIRKRQSVRTLLERGVNMVRCKNCTNDFKDLKAWSKHQREDSKCAESDFEKLETILFVDGNSEKFDVDAIIKPKRDSKGVNMMYLADDYAKSLFPEYDTRT